MLAAALTTLDIAVLAVCALFALRGALRGFVWQAVRLVALFAALWGASACDDPLAERLRAWFPALPPASVPFVAWGAVFVALLLLGAWVAHLARNLIQRADLTSMDRVAGCVLGAATGLFFATLLLVVGGALLDAFQERALLEDAVHDSALAGPMGKAADVLGPLLPDGVRQIWEDARTSVPR
jgi:membrane protein required for colicin V production